MLAVRRLTVPSLFLLGTLALGLILTTGRHAESYPRDNEGPARWEYTTMTLETGDVPARLNELGGEGWEVFSLERAGTVLEQAADGKTRLQMDKVQVTAKRPLRK